MIRDTLRRNYGLCLSGLGVVFILLLLAPAVGADASFRYHGIVVEENGAPISGARIYVYDKFSIRTNIDTGLYLKTLLTAADGSFRLGLEYGNYGLVFSKDGYLSEVMEFYEVNVLDVNIGNVTLRRNVALTITSTSVATPPGARRTIQIQLANRGAIEERVTLTCEAPPGWTAQIRDEGGEVLAVTLTPGSTKTLSLDVDVPLDATSGEVKVTAQGRASVTATLSVVARGAQQPMVTCEYPSKQRTSGGSVDYRVTVSNPLPTPGEVALTLGGLPVGWVQNIVNSAGERITSIYLTAGAKVEVTAHIEIPSSAEESQHNPYVEATIGGRTDRVDLSLAVEHRVLQLGMVTMYPIQLIKQGKDASFPLILENTGESDEVVELSTKFLPERWSGDFENGVGAIIRSVLLRAGARETVTLVLGPPYDVRPGNYDVQAHAASQNLRGNLTLRIGVVGKVDMKATMGNLFGQVTVGETKSFEVKLKNTGFAQITFPRLEAEASVSSLSVECGPLDVVAIQPGEIMTFFVRVTALEGTAQGDYIVEVKAVSKEMQTEPLQIRMTVQASSSQTLTVVVVIAAAFASVLLVYRKFKRR